MKYIYSDGVDFGFKDDQVHDILESDVQISDEDYNTFFEMQASGKQFRLKDIHASSLSEMIEEFTPGSIFMPKTDAQLIAELEQLVADLAALQLGV